MNDEAAIGLIAAGGVLAVTLLVVALVAESDEPEGLAVCVDQATDQRVDDSRCGDFDDTGQAVYSGGFHYMVFDNRSSSRYAGSIPAVGQRMPAVGTTGYIRTYPAGLKVGKGVEASGAPMRSAVSSSITRGGFGVKGAAGSGS